MKRLISGIPLFLTATALLAQDASTTPRELTEKEAQAAAGIFAACGAVGLIGMLVIIALWLWIAIWIMKDSARRNSPNRTLVVVLGWLVPIVGLIVHLATRPKTIPGAPGA
jgi:heme/copper-type cytochrome/quinol oxidase subunit 2